MSATLKVPRGFDPVHLTVDYVEQAAVGQGVSVDEAVRAEIRSVIDERNGRDEMVAEIAHGIPATPGEDGWVEWLVEASEPAERKGEAREEVGGGDEPNSVSFYDRSAFVLVDEEQVIGRVHPGTEGEDGRDVCGEVVKSVRGKDLNFTHDDSIEIRGGKDVVSLKRGVLERKPGKVWVSTTLEVSGYVDFSTGNIDFCGDVEISEGIRDRFTVKAEGSVEVRGLIESATIACGGALLAKGGFAGGERGTAEVGGDLEARYLNSVRGSVAGDLRIGKELIGCDLTVEGGLEAEGATLIGGTLRLVGKGRVKETGSVGGIATVIELGALPKLEPMAEGLVSVIEATRQQLEGLRAENENLKYLKKPDAAQKERMTEIMCDFSMAESRLEKAEAALEALQARMDRERVVDVEVSGRIHPAVVVGYRGERHRFRNEVKGPARLCLDGSGKLVVERASGLTPIEDLTGLVTARAA